MQRFNLDRNCWIDVGSFSLDFDFDILWNLHPTEYSTVRIYGKILKTPRWQASFGKSYYFSGINHKSLPVHHELEPFIAWANSFEEYGGLFNQVLMNWYANGHHYIGKHSDDETQLVSNSPIISISLGYESKFRIRNKSNNKIIRDFILKNGDFIVMGGKMQNYYTHEIVKVSGKKGDSVGKRINITFRQFKL